MTLSLITPSLNQLHFLRECAANVRALGPSVQHVVADGGSTDGTVPFLQSLGLAFRSSSDGGMYAGLNAGAQLCTGGIMGYLNCDDLLFPWTAELVEQAFREHPEADLVVGDSLELRGERGDFFGSMKRALDIQANICRRPRLDKCRLHRTRF